MKADFYKKILSKITLSSIAIFSLFSCGNTTSENSEPSSLPITEVRVSYHNQYSNPTYPLANNEKNPELFEIGKMYKKALANCYNEGTISKTKKISVPKHRKNKRK